MTLMLPEDMPCEAASMLAIRLPLSPAQCAAATVRIRADYFNRVDPDRPQVVQRWAQGIVMEEFMAGAPNDPILLKRLAEAFLPAFCARIARGSSVDSEDLLLAAREALYENFNKGRFAFRYSGGFTRFLYTQIHWSYQDLIREIQDDTQAIQVAAQQLIALPPPDMPHFRLGRGEFSRRLYARVSEAGARVVAGGLPRLHCDWFVSRYLLGQSNAQIAAKERSRQGPLHSSRMSVSRVSTAVSRVRHAFCNEFLALGTQPAVFDPLVQTIYLLWDMGDPALEISEELAEALLRAADLIEGRGKGRPPGCGNRSDETGI